MDDVAVNGHAVEEMGMNSIVAPKKGEPWKYEINIIHNILETLSIFLEVAIDAPEYWEARKPHLKVTDSSLLPEALVSSEVISLHC